MMQKESTIGYGKPRTLAWTLQYTWLLDDFNAEDFISFIISLLRIWSISLEAGDILNTGELKAFIWRQKLRNLVSLLLFFSISVLQHNCVSRKVYLACDLCWWITNKNAARFVLLSVSLADELAIQNPLRFCVTPNMFRCAVRLPALTAQARLIVYNVGVL